MATWDENIKHLQTPITDDQVAELQAGDKVLISGTVYTTRDASGKRLSADLRNGNTPIPLNGQLIFYMGPTPARPGRVIGAAGPTTSARMDAYVPEMLGQGVKAFMGKGRRSLETRQAMRDAGAVYLAAVGGVGALLSQHIGQAKVAAYPELGPEAVYELVLDEFPAVVADDIYGGDIFENEWPAWTR
jgi:fumarate hydratase subunit beta